MAEMKNNNTEMKKSNKKMKKSNKKTDNSIKKMNELNLDNSEIEYQTEILNNGCEDIKFVDTISVPKMELLISTDENSVIIDMTVDNTNPDLEPFCYVSWLFYDSRSMFGSKRHTVTISNIPNESGVELKVAVAHNLKKLVVVAGSRIFVYNLSEIIKELSKDPRKFSYFGAKSNEEKSNEERHDEARPVEIVRTVEPIQTIEYQPIDKYAQVIMSDRNILVFYNYVNDITGEDTYVRSSRFVQSVKLH